MKKAIIFFSRPGSQWNPNKSTREQAYWDDHAHFMDALFDSSKIILGGPFDPDGSGSMVIFAAESVDAVRAIIRMTRGRIMTYWSNATSRRGRSFLMRVRRSLLRRKRTDEA